MQQNEALDWMRLTFDKYPISVVLEAVKDSEWQELREYLKGKSLSARFMLLSTYLSSQKYSDASKVRVTNYVNALRRAGMVKPSNAKKVSSNSNSSRIQSADVGN